MINNIWEFRQFLGSRLSSNIDAVFFINGIYDILCALTILRILHIPVLNELHLSVIKKYKNENPLMERFLAYWLFTYGLMRIFGDRKIIAYSYFTEALFFGNEMVNYDTDTSKSGFIVISSILLGILAIFG
jgi:hypothetical protein